MGFSLHSGVNCSPVLSLVVFPGPRRSVLVHVLHSARHTALAITPLRGVPGVLSPPEPRPECPARYGRSTGGRGLSVPKTHIFSLPSSPDSFIDSELAYPA